MSNMKFAVALAFLSLLLPDFRLASAVGQINQPASIFRPALRQIQLKTRIPILLPKRLPSAIHERDIKLAVGEVRPDGYFISLYFSKSASGAAYAAGFGGSTEAFDDLPNTHAVALPGGRTGIFRPASCGGSCTPANLWWKQNGIEYQIQIELASNLAEKDQQRILVGTVNSIVSVNEGSPKAKEPAN